MCLITLRMLGKLYGQCLDLSPLFSKSVLMMAIITPSSYVIQFNLWYVIVSNPFRILNFILRVKPFLGVFKFVPHILFDNSTISYQEIILIATSFIASLDTKMELVWSTSKDLNFYNIEEFSTFHINPSWSSIMCVLYHSRLVQYYGNDYKEKFEGLHLSWFLLKFRWISNLTFRHNNDINIWKEILLATQVVMIKLSQFKRWDPGRRKKIMTFIVTTLRTGCSWRVTNDRMMKLDFYAI